MPSASLQQLTLLYLTIACHNVKSYKKLRPFNRPVATSLERFLFPWQNRFIFQICPTGEYAMARFGNMQFAAIQLATEDEKQFTEWVSKNKMTGIEAMLSLLQSGFKLSCSYVIDQSAFCLTVIGTDATKSHRDMCMTSWSDDLEEAALIAHYKHFVLCDGGEWPIRQNGTRWG